MTEFSVWLKEIVLGHEICDIFASQWRWSLSPGKIVEGNGGFDIIVIKMIIDIVEVYIKWCGIIVGRKNKHREVYTSEDSSLNWVLKLH